MPLPKKFLQTLALSAVPRRVTSIASWSILASILLLATSSRLLAQATETSKPLTSRQQTQWRSQIRSALFVPDPLPPLNAENHGQFQPTDDVIAERVSYQTQFGLRVPAILYRPKSHVGKLPALIVVNGHGGDKFSWYAFYSGIAYARGGAAVLTYDPIGEGERNSELKSGTRAHDKVLMPDELGRRMGGLMVTDVMQAVSYLRSRPEVDPSRVGAMGYSMGSFILSIAGAADERLRACVLVGGGNLDGPGEYWDKSKPMCQGLPYQALSFLGDRPAAIYALHASRGPTLIFNGLADTVVAIPTHSEDFFHDLRRRTAALVGKQDAVFDYRFVPNISHRPFFLTREVALWLEDKLDFSNWTATDLEKLPTTHISEWATANNVPMDRLYATEEREGGTQAIGTGVPALSRNQLSVMSDDDWHRRKSEFIYETWVAKARQETERHK
jgi:dienelactone hydrolase